METVEILIYLVISLIIGSMIIAFVSDTHTGTLHEQIRSFFFQDEPSFEKVNREDLAFAIFNIWRDCGYGAIDANYTLYAYDNRNMQQHINHSTLFNDLLRYNLCNSLRSESNLCGRGENVEIYNDTSNDPNSTIRGSNLLFITCNATSRNLTISTVFG
ncbi:MAG: hypothetical protein ACMXX8_00710 [Candidatus Woesearchaeota archaeon]